MNSVAVVVLNWNGKEDSLDCITSLSRQQYTNFTIILVDNGSSEAGTEDFLSHIETDFGVTVLRNKTNLGFDGGVNTGIRYALAHDFDYVALFNNDATAEPTWLSRLVSAARKHHTGITTGLLLHEDSKTIDSTGDWYSIWGLPFPRGRNLPTASAPDSGFVFGASGGASLYDIKLFKDIGLFDETFFAYYEDVDISFRAQLRGWKIYYEKSAVAYHKQGATSSKIPGFATYQTLKNLPLVYIKNVPMVMLPRIGIRFWPSYLLIFMNALRNGSAVAAFKGIFAGTFLFWIHGVRMRFRIQRQRRVSIRYIQSIIWHDLPPDQTGLRKLRGRLRSS